MLTRARRWSSQDTSSPAGEVHKDVLEALGLAAHLVQLDARGGLPVANGRVGACQRLECVHNKDLLCTAPAIDVAGDTAECASFTAR